MLQPAQWQQPRRVSYHGARDPQYAPPADSVPAGNSFTYDDILLFPGLPAGQPCPLMAASVRDTGGLLEGMRRTGRGLVCQAAFGDAQQHLLILDQLGPRRYQCALQLGVDVHQLPDGFASPPIRSEEPESVTRTFAAHLTDDDLDMLIVDLNALQTVDLLDLAD